MRCAAQPTQPSPPNSALKTHPTPTQPTPPQTQSKSYTSQFWCMLELDLALNGLPDKRRASKPIVIPVFYDGVRDVVQPEGIEQRWKARLDAAPGTAGAVPAERRQWVQPGRWAQNIADMKERIENVRHVTERIPKGEELQVARRVVAAAVAAARVPPTEADNMVGFDEQEARLLAELAVPDPQRLGLWLHGMGESALGARALLGRHRAARPLRGRRSCRDVTAHRRHPHQLGQIPPRLLYPCRAGGIGKTTMATHLYNHLSLGPSFPKCAQISLDADDSKGTHTQRHLVSALKQLGATDVNDSAPAAQLLTRLRGLVAAGPVLLFVDNAWTATQLDGLLPTSFHPGSRLIITSRHADLRDSDSYWVSLSWT
jgi:hypothetical protein